MKSKTIQLFIGSIFLSVIFIAPCFSGEKNYSLSLEEVTDVALKNSFDIQIAKYDAWIAQTDEDVAHSIYDSVITADIKYQDNRNKQTTTALGTQTRDDDYNVGISKKMPSGTKLRIDMTNNEYWSNSTAQAQTKVFNSDLGISLEQDLGRNFLGIQDRGSIKVSMLDIQQAEYTSLEKIEASIASVQKAYWDLVLNIEIVRVEQDMVGQAKQLFDLHQEKLKDGLVEKPEAIASEANYRKRKNQLALAKNLVSTKENALNLLMNLTGEIANIKPTDSMLLSVGKNEIADSMNVAFKNRRDYLRKKKELESRDVKLSMKKNNLWPTISLKASLDRNGIADHLGAAMGDVFDEDNPELSVMLSVNFPLLNREAKALFKAAEFEKLQEILKMKYLERQIMVEVFDAVRNCNVFREVAVMNKDIAALQAEKLVEEQKRYNYGRSDTDTVIRFQEDLIQAKLVDLQSRFRYVTAIIDLRLKEGYLLNKYANPKNILMN